MSLPPGYTLDDQAPVNNGSALPAGYVLDQPDKSRQDNQPQDNRRWDQKLSDFVTNNTPSYPSGPDMSPIQPRGSGPVSMALSAAGQTLGIQPTTSATPWGAAGETIQNQAMAPARLSNTFGAAVEPVTNASNDYLQKKGVNPYVGAGLSMIAGMATDPRNYIQAGGVSADHPNELPFDVAQQREARTGVPAQQFQALYRDPGALFAGNNIKEAGQNIGVAKEAAGMSAGVKPGDVSSFTPENIQAARSPRVAGKEALNNILLKISKNEGEIEGAGITPNEISAALKDSNSRLAKLQPGTEPFQQEAAIKSHLNNILEQVSPEVKAANKAYARAKLGEAFSPMHSVNKTGTTSKMGMLADAAAAGVGAILGHVIPGINPLEGGVAGGALAKYGNQLYHAPFVAGLQTAGGAMANRALDPLLTALEKAGTSPAAQALVARYFQQQQAKSQNKGQ